MKRLFRSDSAIMYYLSGFIHGVFFMLLLALAMAQYGCRQRQDLMHPYEEPYMQGSATPAKSEPAWRPCADVRPPTMGQLLVCDDGDASCERVNVLRKLAHLQAMETWGDWVVAVCDIYDAPSWSEL